MNLLRKSVYTFLQSLAHNSRIRREKDVRIMYLKLACSQTLVFLLHSTLSVFFQY